MNCTIVARHAPDWGQLADIYRRTGRYDATKFLPNPTPPGFPNDLAGRIDLWNNTFSVDFFTCREELSKIARSSWDAVQNASIISSDQLRDTVGYDSNTVYCFTDDDDWFAPHLLDIEQIDDAHALRWPSPVFDGEIVFRPVSLSLPRVSSFFTTMAHITPGIGGRAARRLYRHIFQAQIAMKRLLLEESLQNGLTQRPCDFLFQTNNYCVTGKLLNSYLCLDRVVDHVHASMFFMSHPVLRIKAVELIWSMTNKHPCSATMLFNATNTSNPRLSMLGAVTEYVHATKMLQLTKRFEWSAPLIAQTQNLFERCIDNS